MIKKDVDPYKEARLTLINVRHLWWIGNSYIKTVSELEKTNTGNFVSIELLSTQAVEILLKSYLGAKICVDNKGKSETEISSLIDDSFRKVNHNLEKLFNEVQDLKSLLNIISVELVSNRFVSDYILNMANGDIFYFKELESVRYGSFAKNTNVINGFLVKGQTAFLEDISKKVHEKITESMNLLQNRSS